MARFGRRQPHKPIILSSLPTVPQPPIGRVVANLQAVQKAARLPRVKTQVLRWLAPATPAAPPIGKTVFVRTAVPLAARPPRIRTKTYRAGGQPSRARFIPPGRETVRRSWRISYGRVLAPHFRIVGVPFPPCPAQAVVMRLTVPSVVMTAPTVQSVAMQLPDFSVEMLVAGDGLLLLDCDTYILYDRTQGFRLESTDLAGDVVCMRLVVQEVVLRCPHQ